jgi:hypothetical protein
MLKLDEMNLTNEEYVRMKSVQRKQKQIKQQVKNNQKSMRGFGYTYKEITHDS